MTFHRFLLVIIVGCYFVFLQSVSADESLPPFTFPKEYSVELISTGTDGTTIPAKIYFSNGWVRSAYTEHGTAMVFILRPDLQKVYVVVADRKMVMQQPYDTEQFKKIITATSGPEGKFEAVGSDPVDGVQCTKYKVTDADGKISYWWINAATKLPVKMTPTEDRLLAAAQWKNFKVGPQDPALFELPPGYQVLGMYAPLPELPKAPAGH